MLLHLKFSSLSQITQLQRWTNERITKLKLIQTRLTIHNSNLATRKVYYLNLNPSLFQDQCISNVSSNYIIPVSEGTSTLNLELTPADTLPKVITYTISDETNVNLTTDNVQIDLLFNVNF